MAKIVKAELEETEEVEIEGGDAQYPDLSKFTPSMLLKLKEDAEKALASSKSDRILKLHDKFDAEAKKEGFTLQQVFFKGKTAEGKKYPVKYRNPANHNETWTGQGGNRPKWMVIAIAAAKARGEERTEDFYKIVAEAAE